MTGYWAMFAAMAESLNPPLEQSIVTVVEGMYLVAGLQGQVRELAGTFGQLQKLRSPWAPNAVWAVSLQTPPWT